MTPSFKDMLKKKAERAEQADRPAIDWFLLKNNNPARIVFLQELDPDAPNYDSSKGSALFLVEHSNPEKFQRKAVCTMETEGRCIGCELNADPEFAGKGWWQKTNFYVQVFDAKDEKVKVLSRPAPGPAFDFLTDWAAEENEGNLTGVTFKISKGPNNKDPWVFATTKNTLEVPDGIELLDLEKAVGIRVPVEKQRKFYLPDGDPVSAPAEIKSTSSDAAMDW